MAQALDEPGRVIAGDELADDLLRLRQALEPMQVDADVLSDLYREAVPDPMDITRFEWEVILRFMGATAEEIAAVQRRMGRVWR